MNKCVPRVRWTSTMATLSCETHGKVKEWCRRVIASPAAMNKRFEDTWEEHVHEHSRHEPMAEQAGVLH